MALHTHTVDSEGNLIRGCSKQTFADPCDVCGRSVHYRCWCCSRRFRFNEQKHCHICGWAICPDCKECGCSPNRTKSNEELQGRIFIKKDGEYTVSDIDTIKKIKKALEDIDNDFAQTIKEFVEDAGKITRKQLETLTRYKSVRVIYDDLQGEYEFVKYGKICGNCKYYKPVIGKRNGFCNKFKSSEQIHWRDEDFCFE